MAFRERQRFAAAVASDLGVGITASAQIEPHRRPALARMAQMSTESSPVKNGVMRAVEALPHILLDHATGD